MFGNLCSCEAQVLHKFSYFPCVLYLLLIKNFLVGHVLANKNLKESLQLGLFLCG